MQLGNDGDIWRFLEDEKEEPEYFLLIERLPHPSDMEIYKGEERWQALFLNNGQAEQIYIHFDKIWTKVA